MLYALFRWPVRLLLLFFFRRIHRIGVDHVPKNKAVLFISNHSNAFMDPILIASFQEREIYFWARAQEFKQPIYNWILKNLHILPIYRIRDGRKLMNKNRQTFASSKQLLAQNKAMYIAPEGNCTVEKRMRRFKLGTARLILEIMEEKGWDFELEVVPVGLNYTYHTKFRSEVYMQFGAPIKVDSYQELSVNDRTKAVRALTNELEDGLRSQLIIVKDKADDELAEQILLLYRNSNTQSYWPIIADNERWCHDEQKLATWINTLAPAEKETLKQRLDQYYKKLERAKITDRALAQQNKPALGNFVKLALGWPVFLVGIVGGWLPMQLARMTRNKMVKDIQFWAGVALVWGWIYWAVYSLVLVVALVIMWSWWALLLPVGLIAAQYLALEYQEIWKAVSEDTIYQKWSKGHSKQNRVLKKEREAIIKGLGDYS
ncbi:MAG: hypothetical protein GY810_25340 [Aureispira sp.]|nr:hypothetical protein [Aureispira sp.]